MAKKKFQFDKLQKMIPNAEMNSLRDLIIYQEADGSYQLFNRYVINKKSAAEYAVTTEFSDDTHMFNTLKNATAWCIFDKRDKFYEARRILELDNKLGGLDVDIMIHQKLFKKSKTDEDQLIFIAKLNEDRIKKQMIVDELDSYVSESKSWQERRFERKAA
jgi:hypothetical protein